MILVPKSFGNVKKIKAKNDKASTKVTLKEPPMKEIKLNSTHFKNTRKAAEDVTPGRPFKWSTCR